MSSQYACLFLGAENVEHNEASNCDSDRGHGLPVFLQMDCTLNDCDFFLHELLIPVPVFPF